MANDTHVYGEIDNQSNLKDVFLEIRRGVEEADSRRDLTKLYRQAGYLIALTHSPAWEKKFGSDVKTLRQVGQEEFARTARKLNHRAEDIGTEPDYDEKWGD
jgi:hypothetical protein